MINTKNNPHEVAEDIITLLTNNNETLCLAESITGGLLCSTLTDIPGSSKAILESVVTYSISSKNKRLGIPKSDIEQYGVISDHTACQMAKKVRILLMASYGFGVTGNAGPTVDQKNTNVGSVFMAISSKSNSCSKHFLFTKSLSRLEIKNKTVFSSLHFIWEFISNGAVNNK
ncbi:MAG: CinA family protein [Caldisericia bacterium]|nr:CinA family protein [Caldisericia bacterium]